MAVGFAKASKVGRGFNLSIVEKRVRQHADLVADELLQRLATAAVEEAETIIRETISGSDERRKETARPLEGSIRAKIVGSGLQAELVLYSIDNPKKAGAIEFGVRHDYTIKAKKRDEKGGKFLYFPHNVTRATSGLALAKLPSVVHHAFPGKFYMRRGVNRAMRRVLNIH